MDCQDLWFDGVEYVTQTVEEWQRPRIDEAKRLLLPLVGAPSSASSYEVSFCWTNMSFEWIYQMYGIVCSCEYKQKIFSNIENVFFNYYKNKLWNMDYCV